MHPSRKIALLGAESTGKTRLATELATHLCGLGLRAVAVPEVLREWCTRAGRTPRPEEQLAIAREQESRVDTATRDADIVIADTTALMVAIYAGMLFEDGELLAFALARQRGYDATLVTGLDLPWIPDGLQRDASQSREPVDALVRSLLARADVGYQVVYGQGPQRLRSALQALGSAGVLPAGTLAPGEAGGSAGATLEDGAGATWTWLCDKCGDPACEHRLFTKLQAARR